MSFRLQAGRIEALLAVARAKDGLPLAAHPADMPMLATLGLAAAAPLDGDGRGERMWRLTLAGYRAVDALEAAHARGAVPPTPCRTGRSR